MQENEKIDSFEKLRVSLGIADNYNHVMLNAPTDERRNEHKQYCMDVMLPAIHGMRGQSGEQWATSLLRFMTDGKVPRVEGYSNKWVLVPPPDGADETFFRNIPNEDNYWVWRECHRFSKEIYKRPQVHHVLNTYKPELWFHFAHASIEEPHMIAYTPNHEYGKRDRQVRVKVGRYLQQFYGDVLSAEEIRAAVNNCKPYEISWAVTGDEMERVYVDGPNSCMSGNDDFDSDMHPVHVYEGEFKLAYIEVGGEITARCLVHEPTKTWVRHYGSDGPVLADMLEGLEYTKAENWVGAKLKLIHDGDGYLAPYLDGDSKWVDIVGSYMLVKRSSGEFYLDNTNGLTCDSGTSCDDCGDRHDEDDVYWSEYHDRTIGPCCINNYNRAIYNHSGDRTYVAEDETIYCESDSEYYLNDPRVYGHYNVAQCESDGQYYNMDDMVQTINDQWVHMDNAILCGEDKHENKYCLADDIEPDWVVHKDEGGISFFNPEYLPEAVRAEYESEDDEGNVIELPMQTVKQFVETSTYKMWTMSLSYNLRCVFRRMDEAYVRKLSQVAL